jgi:hypothetical protein
LQIGSFPTWSCYRQRQYLALSTRFDIHADTAAGRQAIFLGVQYVEIDKMNKIPMVAALALVLGAPLAFAADSNVPSPSAMTTTHCSNLETPSPIKGGAMDYSSAKKQTAEEEAMSLCKWDYHKNGGVHAFNEAKKPGTTAPALFLVRR